LARARIIILNGPGSVGKSSTARALQAITAEPFLHLAMDTFLGMLPPGTFGDPQGYVFETIVENGRPFVVVHVGPIVERALRGMRHAVAAMAAQANNLIVDDVMLGGGEAEEYRSLLSGHEVRFVGLFAPLDLLEARERDRGDRDIGLARWQHERVHRGVRYDLEIDTARTTPTGSAERIRAAFNL
jgi:chloramphenicol 3-O phosphotransferase